MKKIRKQESLLDEVTKHFQWQQAKTTQKRQVELRIARPARLYCPECHVLSTSPASLALSARLSSCDSSHRRNETTGVHRDTEEGTRGGQLSVWARMKKARQKSGRQNVGLNLSRVNTYCQTSIFQQKERILHFKCLYILICFISMLRIAHQYTTILWMPEAFLFFLFFCV